MMLCAVFSTAYSVHHAVRCVQSTVCAGSCVLCTLLFIMYSVQRAVCCVLCTLLFVMHSVQRAVYGVLDEQPSRGSAGSVSENDDAHESVTCCRRIPHQCCKKGPLFHIQAFAQPPLPPPLFPATLTQ